MQSKCEEHLTDEEINDKLSIRLQCVLHMLHVILTLPRLLLLLWRQQKLGIRSILL